MKKTISSITVTWGYFLMPLLVSAQLHNPLEFRGERVETLGDFFIAIATFLFQISTPLMVIAIMIGGFQMMFSGGDEKKFARGKEIITYSLVAYAIIIVAFGLPALVVNVLSGN